MIKEKPVKLTNKLLIVLFSLLLTNSILGQKITIDCIATDYAGEEIIAYKFSNLITYQEEELAKISVSDSGSFSFSFIADEVSFIFFYLGVYKAYMFVEPGKQYQIILPERKDKSKAQLLNPFFEEENMHIGVLNSDSTELNYQIAVFDTRYNNKLLEVMKASKYSYPKALIDSTIQELNEQFSYSTHTYFKDYKSYRITFFNLLSNQLKVKKVTSLQFVNKPFLYNNMGFMELFNNVFKNYFNYHSRTAEGKKLPREIANKSLSGVKDALGQNDLLKNDTIKELVILKSLYDEFYSDNFSRSAMLAILDSLYFTSTIPEHQLIAQDIRGEVTHLLRGFFPPDFQLKDKDGKIISLKDYRGKYVYLNFAHTQSYTCLQDFEILKELHERYKNDLEIISVCIDEDEKDLWYFLNVNQYNWTFLYYGNDPKILQEFDLRAYPTYFLVDRTGRLMISPANSPTENFEFIIQGILRSEKINAQN